MLIRRKQCAADYAEKRVFVALQCSIMKTIITRIVVYTHTHNYYYYHYYYFAVGVVSKRINHARRLNRYRQSAHYNNCSVWTDELNSYYYAPHRSRIVRASRV